jgi:hypothetical protein
MEAYSKISNEQDCINDKLHKWDDSTRKYRPQLESEVCKFTKEWNTQIYDHQKKPCHIAGLASNWHVESTCMIRIKSVRGEVWVNTSSLRPPLVMELLVPKTGQWAVMYLCVRSIDFASFYDFDIWYWNCSDSVVFLHFILLYFQTV